MCGLVILIRLRKTLEGTEVQRHLCLRRWLSDTPDLRAPIIAALDLAIRNTAVRYARVENLLHHYVLLYVVMWRRCSPALVRGPH